MLLTRECPRAGSLANFTERDNNGIEAGAEEKLLAPGDTIGTTQSAVVLENLIGQFLYNKAAEGPAAPASQPKK